MANDLTGMAFGEMALDRADRIRSNPEALEAAKTSSGARAIVLWRGRPLTDCPDELEDPEALRVLRRLPMDHPVLKIAQTPPLFLGLLHGEALFAFDLSPWEPEGTAPEEAFIDHSTLPLPAVEGAAFVDLRSNLSRIGAEDAELAATARALMLWHATHGFCARCGAESEVVHAGWQRKCPSCGASHFPRTDPVVIMLVTKGNDTLLGRSPGWPEGMYSCLAGFVEPGETLEAAVRREVHEEAGVDVEAVHYVASQPWPFPMSLMFGAHGVATTSEITRDALELEDALWVSRERLARIFAREDTDIKAPRQGSIAFLLLSRWLRDQIPNA